jgi:fatty acyl-CoA reductase
MNTSRGRSDDGDVTMNTASDVPGFFKGRSVFITGGTGFMGKVLLEKLLRSCPGIATIYLLMRPKRGNDVRIRQEELIRCQVRVGHLTFIVQKTADTSATGRQD